MVAHLSPNIEILLEARGLSATDLSTRVGAPIDEIAGALSGELRRKEALIQKVASELLVPDFLLFVEDTPVLDLAVPDFRKTEPSRRSWQRETLSAIELGRRIQATADQLGRYNRANAIEAVVGANLPPGLAAKKLRQQIGLTSALQLEIPDARHLFTFVRRAVENFELFVLQLSFPTADGAGFCLASRDTFDVIAVNTYKSMHERRLFTLAHEIYHCIYNVSGVSDPYVINNSTERKCNEFAVEFLAPSDLVLLAAKQAIHSRQFDIEQIRRFGKLTKLSFHASVLRLVELGLYNQSAIAQWHAYLATKGNPDIPKGGGGGGRVEEWRYKVSRYGFGVARVFGSAEEAGELEPLEIFRVTGIKPKYQKSYFRNATSADLGEVEDE